MSERIKVKQYMAEQGIEDLNEYLEELVSDSICPAMCTSGCEVEPDGKCEHGHPSIMLALGII